MRINYNIFFNILYKDYEINIHNNKIFLFFYSIYKKDDILIIGKDNIFNMIKNIIKLVKTNDRNK